MSLTQLLNSKLKKNNVAMKGGKRDKMKLLSAIDRMPGQFQNDFEVKENLMNNGRSVNGLYHRKTGKIELRPNSNMRTIIHELSHALPSLFPKSGTHFVTPYASTDKYEDFAESTAEYVTNGNGFRDVVTRSKQLEEKYNFLKNLYNGREFDTGISEGLYYKNNSLNSSERKRREADRKQRLMRIKFNLH